MQTVISCGFVVRGVSARRRICARSPADCLMLVVDFRPLPCLRIFGGLPGVLRLGLLLPSLLVDRPILKNNNSLNLLIFYVKAVLLTLNVNQPIDAQVVKQPDVRLCVVVVLAMAVQ